MSQWEITADVREIFVDLCATRDGETKFFRTLNRKDVLSTGLIEIFKKDELLPASLKLRTDVQRVFTREHWGENTALITTEGFEDLLSIGDSTRSESFGSIGTHPPSIIPQDQVFGIAERIDAHGKIVRPLEKSDFDFFLSKLKLAQIKTVCVSLINAKQNPQHEKQLAEWLKAENFAVFTGHQREGSERQRTQACTMEGIAKEPEEKICEELEKIGISQENIQFVDSWQSHAHSGSDELHLGCYEDRTTLTLFKNGDEILKTDLSLHPCLTLNLDNDIKNFHLATIGPASVGSEPGPICLGKGIEPCILDALALVAKLEPPDISRIKFEPKKLERTMAAMAKRMSETTMVLARSYLDMYLKLLTSEIRTHIPLGFEMENCHLVTQGPLAEIFCHPVAKLLNITKFQGNPWGPLSSSESNNVKGHLKFGGAIEL